MTFPPKMRRVPSTTRCLRKNPNWRLSLPRQTFSATAPPRSGTSTSPTISPRPSAFAIPPRAPATSKENPSPSMRWPATIAASSASASSRAQVSRKPSSKSTPARSWRAWSRGVAISVPVCGRPATEASLSGCAWLTAAARLPWLCSISRSWTTRRHPQSI